MGIERTLSIIKPDGVKKGVMGEIIKRFENAGLSVIAVSQSDNKYSKYAVQGAALAAIIALELPNSRNAETEADRIGIEIAAKAGFDPQAAITLWEKMDKNLGDKKRPPVFGLRVVRSRRACISKSVFSANNSTSPCEVPSPIH